MKTLEDMRTGLKKILSLMTVLILTITASSAVSEAAAQRVMLTDYKTNKEVVSGKDFSIDLIFTNESAKKVTNMKVSISSENGEFIPIDGAGTAYVSEIASKKSETVTFSLNAITGLSEKSYKLYAKIEYEGNNGTPYEVTETIYLPVKLTSKASLTDVYVEDDSFEVGESTELTAKVNNTGNATLYNVTVKVEGDNVADASSYVGNIEAGKSGYVDIVLRGMAVSDGDKKNNKITVTYEDAKGNEKSISDGINVSVTSPKYDEYIPVVQSQKKEMPKNVGVYVLVGLCVVAFVVVKVLREKKKQKDIEDMFS